MERHAVERTPVFLDLVEVHERRSEKHVLPEESLSLPPHHRSTPPLHTVHPRRGSRSSSQESIPEDPFQSVPAVVRTFEHVPRPVPHPPPSGIDDKRIAGLDFWCMFFQKFSVCRGSFTIFTGRMNRCRGYSSMFFPFSSMCDPASIYVPELLVIVIFDVK